MNNLTEPYLISGLHGGEIAADGVVAERELGGCQYEGKRCGGCCWSSTGSWSHGIGAAASKLPLVALAVGIERVDGTPARRYGAGADP